VSLGIYLAEASVGFFGGEGFIILAGRRRPRLRHAGGMVLHGFAPARRSSSTLAASSAGRRT
jgi:hypothetical protein